MDPELHLYRILCSEPQTQEAGTIIHGGGRSFTSILKNVSNNQGTASWNLYCLFLNYTYFFLSFRVVREKIILVAAAKNDCK